MANTGQVLVTHYLDPGVNGKQKAGLTENKKTN